MEPKLKTPWHSGTTHLVMSLLEFMQGLLAAPATRPPAMAASWSVAEGQLWGAESRDL